MPRHAKLRDKDGWWATDAKGSTKRFGKVAETAYKDALQAFREFLAQPVKTPDVSQLPSPLVSVLATKFLEWVKANRGEKAHEERARHIGRFEALYGNLECSQIYGHHLDSYVESLVSEKHSPDYVHKHIISVKAMFNKGIKKGWLAPTVRPFENCDPIRREHKALTESKLPTDEEVAKLFAAADLAMFGSMGDILRMYHATGARTGELMAVRAGDFQRKTRQIVLANHKRSHTLREAAPRTISLNSVAYEIMRRRTDGLADIALAFPRPRDQKFQSANNLANRFNIIRRQAGVRPGITIYSFRHLWISEALMAGVDLLLVARMAGTSVEMIERVYGHFRATSYQEAQSRLDAARAARASL